MFSASSGHRAFPKLVILVVAAVGFSYNCSMGAAYQPLVGVPSSRLPP